jgi:ribosomal-protein-alanine N-acetyltransferase
VTRRISPLPSGAAAVLAIMHAACFPAEPWDAEALARILGLAGAFGLLVWQGEQPVGFAAARNLGDEVEILTIGVLPDYRGQGYGRDLLTAVAAEAGRRGAGSLVLEVAETNTAARGLYRAFGFAQVGRRPGYYRNAAGAEDGLILRCNISGNPLVR